MPIYANMITDGTPAPHTVWCTLHNRVREADMQQAQRQSIRELADTIRGCFPGKPPEQIAVELGGAVEVRDEIEGDALAKVEALSGESPKFRITVRREPAAPEERQLSIAHELGHLFLHMGFLTSDWRNDAQYTDSAMYRAGFSHDEAEADEFAHSLLMPEADFSAAVQKLTNNDTINIQDIAKKFGVPVSAAGARGRLLGLFEWEL